MKTIEMKDLIIPLLGIILIASSVGKLEELHSFAAVQVAKSLKGWEPHHFFPQGYGRQTKKPADSKIVDKIK